MMSYKVQKVARYLKCDGKHTTVKAKGVFQSPSLSTGLSQTQTSPGIPNCTFISADAVMRILVESAKSTSLRIRHDSGQMETPYGIADMDDLWAFVDQRIK